jgi:hypothetical protein
MYIYVYLYILVYMCIEDVDDTSSADEDEDDDDDEDYDDDDDEDEDSDETENAPKDKFNTFKKIYFEKLTAHAKFLEGEVMPQSTWFEIHQKMGDVHKLRWVEVSKYWSSTTILRSPAFKSCHKGNLELYI